MKKYCPGASMNSDYAYGCDICGKWGSEIIIWNDLTDDRDHFCLCPKCISRVYLADVAKIDKADERITVKRRSVTEKVRTDIFSRDGNRCLFCGSKNNLTLDHIIPFSRGGSTNKKNLQTLCLTCNMKKGVK